jgi:3-phytase
MFGGCRGFEPDEHPPDMPGSLSETGNRQIVQISEAYQSASFPEDDIDSVAIWHGSEQQHWLIATAKATHRILIFDASSGAFLRAVGGPGKGLGEYQRPNGIAVIDSNLVVVERDNHRIQVLKLPDLSPLGRMGSDDLVRPYGLALLPTNEIFVTDNCDPPETLEVLNEALAGLPGGRIKHYTYSINEANGVESKLLAQFGDTEGSGVLSRVETIAADADNNRLLIADELKKVFKIYSLDGRFTGKIMGEGVFRYEPEGIALIRCGNEGYWIACDQEESQSFFRVFDRNSLGYIGTFVGNSTANTDGVALAQTPFPSFPQGAFFAVHNDSAVSAFDLGEILSGLDLDCCF